MLERFIEFFSVTGFARFYWGDLLVILIGSFVTYLLIRRSQHPFLLISIGFGAILADLSPLIANPKTFFRRCR